MYYLLKLIKSGSVTPTWGRIAVPHDATFAQLKESLKTSQRIPTVVDADYEFFDKDGKFLMVSPSLPVNRFLLREQWLTCKIHDRGNEISFFISPERCEDTFDGCLITGEHRVMQCADKEGITLEESLKAYTVADLALIAGKYGLETSTSRKERMAREVARYLLEPENIKVLCMDLPGRNLDAFEQAIEKGCHVPDKEEWQYLGALYDRNYVTVFDDGSVVVPREVVFAYSIIKGRGYRRYHEKAEYLLKCLKFMDLVHGCATTETLYRMFGGDHRFNLTFHDFSKLFMKFPDPVNPCHLMSGLLISKKLTDEEAKDRLGIHTNVEYYIAKKQEVESYAKYGYSFYDAEYKELYYFFLDGMDYSIPVSNYLCRKVFHVAANAGDLSEYKQLLTDAGVELQPEAMKRYMEIVQGALRSTRSYLLKGHKPQELPKSPVTMPIFRMDQGVGGTLVAASKKIYPADPCPCGSGRPYCLCCQRGYYH